MLNIQVYILGIKHLFGHDDEGSDPVRFGLDENVVDGADDHSRRPTPHLTLRSVTPIATASYDALEKEKDI